MGYVIITLIMAIISVLWLGPGMAFIWIIAAAIAGFLAIVGEPAEVTFKRMMDEEQKRIDERDNAL